MKTDDEFEKLLSEIPQVTSSLNLHSPALADAMLHRYQQQKIHGYGHAPSRASHGINGLRRHGHGYVDGMYGGDKMMMMMPRHRYAAYPSSSSSPLSGFSFPYDESLLSGNGRLSLSAIGSPTPPLCEEQLRNTPLGYGNGGGVMDFFNLAGDFSRISTNDGQEGFIRFDPYTNGAAFRMNLDNHEASDGYRSFFQDPCRGPLSYDVETVSAFPGMQEDRRNLGTYRSERSVPQQKPANHALSPQFPVGGDGFFYASQNRMNLIETNPNHRWRSYYGDEKLLHYKPPVPNGRLRVPRCLKMSQQSGDAFTGEESFIFQGENGGQTRSRGYDKGRNKLRCGNDESCRSPKMCSPSYFSSKNLSLEGAREHICRWAKDQNGGRYLQGKLDERKEVDLIFNEIIKEAVELMMDPFGNYLMQKVLDVCNEEQRMLITLRATEKPGQIVTISLDTHGTRVVQKLIDTVTSKQQVKLIVSALEPGFLLLIKDLNGNHVIQKCLSCFSDEDSKFIFVGAAKYCVDIATHQHGCCVLQQCIAHSTGDLKELLVAKIAANALHLSRDAFGNYAVQYVFDIKIPSAAATMTSHLRGSYVDLSRDKFGSHVVEKCLRVCDDRVKSSIVNELLSVGSFEHLLQDPLANYVIQTALKVSEGALHNSLVEKIESCRERTRNSPYSKGIFSKKLLRK